MSEKRTPDDDTLARDAALGAMFYIEQAIPTPPSLEAACPAWRGHVKDAIRYATLRALQLQRLALARNAGGDN